MVTFELMGTLVFIIGLFVLVIAVVSTLAPVARIGETERFTLFIAGAGTCAIGYYMSTRTRE